MFKRILSLVLVISFLSVGFCFAFDTSSIKSIWDDCVPKISEYWGLTLNWINTDMKPWIEKNIGTKTRQEFEKEFSEAIQYVPVTIKAVIDRIKDIFN
jgi:hypothetical protein